MFNPENFSREARASRPVTAFLSFGLGPRNCIGWRFALQEIKIAMATLVTKFDFKAGDETPRMLTRDPTYMANWYTIEPLKVLVEERI